MIVKEGADSHPGRCCIIYTVKSLAKDDLLDILLSLYPFHFGLAHSSGSWDAAKLLL